MVVEVFMSAGPARKIRRSAVKSICKFPSTKSGINNSKKRFEMILVESLLEKDFCFHLEFDRSVLRYFPQPKTFSFSHELLINHEYTPDFEVHYAGGRKAYVEVKKDFTYLDDIYLLKLDMATIEMRACGYDFYKVDELYIKVQPFLDNARRLQRYRNEQSVDLESLISLKECVPAPSILNDLINNPKNIKVEIIYGLIAAGYIRVDITSMQLSVNIEVSYA